MGGFSNPNAHRKYRSEKRRKKQHNGERRHQPTRPSTPVDRTEIAASKALALKMIDAGYKILAQEYHPDKGGSTEAMARLNRIRANLKIIVERTN